MEIFARERKDGLEQLITSNSVAYTLSIKVKEPNQELKAIAEKLAANANQGDLFYIESTLASSGWNKNDDIFGVAELWNARHTPVQKQVNLNHDEKKIVGNIYSSWATDFDGNEIPNDTPLEDLKELDIHVASVIYKRWEDEEMQTAMAEVLEQIQAGVKKVSMECLFPRFDYGLIAPDGSQKVVARNEETAFLTKHLRVYGGSGTFNGYRVGRYLRDFYFSGKAIVDNPANPRSDIHSFSFVGAAASELPKVKIMDEDQVKAMRQELDTAKADLAVAKSNLTVKDNEIEALKTAVAKADEEKTAIAGELETEKALSAEKSEKITTLETKYNESKAELEKVQAEIKTKSRVAALTAVKVEQGKAEELVTKFAAASDEMFEEVVKLHASKEPETPATPEKTQETTAEELENAEEEASASLAVETEDETETLRAKASEYFGQLLKTKEKK